MFNCNSFLFSKMSDTTDIVAIIVGFDSSSLSAIGTTPFSSQVENFMIFALSYVYSIAIPIIPKDLFVNIISQ